MSADGVRASMATSGRITQLAIVEPIPDYLTWSRLPDGRRTCLTAPELIGVESKDHQVGKVLLEVFRRLKAELPGESGASLQAAIAVPRVLPEPQRRRLLNAVQEFFGRAILIDSTTAALYAVPEPIPKAAAGTLTIVAEDLALETCIALPDNGNYQIRGYHSIPELSRHALHHHLFQTVLDRLPAAMQERLAEADDDTLSKLFIRLLRMGSMLSRLESMTCSLVELGSPPPSVPIATKDITSWLEPRLNLAGSAIEELIAEIGCRVDRVLLVGGWGEWASFQSRIEEICGAPLVYNLECVADGAALAAAAASVQNDRLAVPGSLVPLNEALAHRSSFISFTKQSPIFVQSPEEKLQDFFSDIAQLVADHKFDRVRQLLTSAKQRTEAILVALENPASIENAPQAWPDATPADRIPAPDLQEKEFRISEMTVAARRGFEEAERLLRSGRVLQAVGSSHLAHQQSPASHDALLYMLDIHRRGAKILADGGDYKTAEQQLRCALHHRQSDERTRRALGQLLLQHARYQEDEVRDYTEAQHFYVEALDCVDDDLVPEIEKALKRLLQRGDSRG